MTGIIKYYYMNGCHYCELAKPLIYELKKQFPMEEIEASEIEASEKSTLVDGFPTLVVLNQKYEKSSLHLDNKNTIIKWIQSKLKEKRKKRGGNSMKKGGNKKRGGTTRKRKQSVKSDKKMTFTRGKLNGVEGIFLTKYKRVFIPA